MDANMNSMSKLGGDLKRKGFFKRPEGKTGLLFILGLIVGGGWLLLKALPFIIILLSNLITTIALGAVLFLMVMLLLNKRFRTIMWYGFQIFMKKLTSIIVKIDPISIIKSYVEDLKKQHEKINANLEKLRGQIELLKRNIDDNAKDMKTSFSMMSQAKKTGNKGVLIVKSRRFGHLKESNKTLTDLLNKMNKLYKVLAKMYEVTGYSIEWLEQEVEMKEKEYKTIKTASSAMESAMKIVQGDPDKRAIFEQSLEFLEEDISDRVGRMQRFIETSTNFIDTVDMQNGMYEEEALEELEAFENQGYEIMMGDMEITPDRLLNADNNKISVGDLSDKNKVKKPVIKTEYSGLFD